MRFGFHLSVAGGLCKSVGQARDLGLDCLQIFAGNPRSWKQRPIDEEEAARFRAAALEAGLDPVVLHAPYLINLASPDQDLWRRSVRQMAGQLRRARVLGAAAVVVHPGSRGDKALDWGMERVIKGVERALEESGGGAEVWLENTAGGGGRMGATLSQLQLILRELSGLPVGLCLDTAHAWGAGYDLHDQRRAWRFLDAVKATVGLVKVKLWHFNDTEVERGSFRDRHQHLGQGQIGREGFGALLAHPGLVEARVVMETPKNTPDADRNNLAFVLRLGKAASTVGKN